MVSRRSWRQWDSWLQVSSHGPNGGGKSQGISTLPIPCMTSLKILAPSVGDLGQLAPSAGFEPAACGLGMSLRWSCLWAVMTYGQFSGHVGSLQCHRIELVREI
jgi:hypothetical protein